MSGKGKKIFLGIAGGILVLGALGSCKHDTNEAAVENKALSPAATIVSRSLNLDEQAEKMPTVTATARQEATPSPTATVKPTNTPTPASTQKPTDTPSATSTVEPIATSAVTPSVTSTVTATRKPISLGTDSIRISGAQTASPAPSKSSPVLTEQDAELTDQDIFIFQGQKIELQSTVEKLIVGAETSGKYTYTSNATDVVRVSKDGTATAAKLGTATVHCESQEDPLLFADVTIHVVKSVNRVVLGTNKVELSVPEQNGNSVFQLTYKVEPEDAYVQTGTWESSNETVARVDENGRIEAVGTGNAKITFVSDDTSKGKKTATCNVSVAQAVTSLVLPESTGVVYVGKQVQLKPTIQPSNARNKKVTWSSSDERVATVNNNGQVKGVSPGVVTITGTSSDGPSVDFRATVKIAPVTLRVSFSASLIQNDHVGNHWGKEFYLNGSTINGSASVKVNNGDTITVGCTIWDNDSKPEYGDFERTITITPEIMTKGLQITADVWVTENGGRYSGHSALWRVVITIKP